MSKLARKPLSIPAGVTVSLADGIATVKGPKGELAVRLLRGVTCTPTPEGLVVALAETTKETKPNAGTSVALLRNAMAGVSQGYEKKLEIEGVGFRAAMEGATLVLSLGFVNPVKMPVPKGLAVSVEKNTITVAGINKEAVGQFAAEVRAKKKPEPYKGKGIRYAGEVIRRKAGKKAATASS